MKKNINKLQLNELTDEDRYMILNELNLSNEECPENKIDLTLLFCKIDELTNSKWQLKNSLNAFAISFADYETIYYNELIDCLWNGIKELICNMELMIHD